MKCCMSAHGGRSFGAVIHLQSKQWIQFANTGVIPDSVTIVTNQKVAATSLTLHRPSVRFESTPFSSFVSCVSSSAMTLQRQNPEEDLAGLEGEHVAFASWEILVEI